VLYEIVNESDPSSWPWQYHMVQVIRDAEVAAGLQEHPIGLTASWPDAGPSLDTLLASPADWISPGFADSPDYKTNPPVSTGKKVIVLDTDHIWGMGGNPEWVWKSFFRGLNPIYLDRLDNDGQRVAVRQAMGWARALSRQVDLLSLVPRGGLTSTGYCLATSGAVRELLAYAPDGGDVTVKLTGSSGSFHVEWLEPSTGRLFGGQPVSGGAPRTLRPPFGGSAVVHLTLSH
jgi:hypothetical protein